MPKYIVFFLHVKCKKSASKFSFIAWSFYLLQAGIFKTRFYNPTKSFNIEEYKNETKLSKSI